MRRYRVHYKASFDVDIQAKDMTEARYIAGMAVVAEKPFTQAQDITHLHLAWNTIEPIGGNDD